MKVYYNDFDKKACAWLKELIKDGLLPKGHVDDRSIIDIKPEELEDYDQVHLFAGIGGWAHALELAKWPSNRRVWNGSCPCQPWSCAGRGKGKKDPRHLWPEFRRLIEACKPPEIFGEQVASSKGRLWLADVRSDLESLGYEVAAADLCAGAVGAPHIRQRLFFVARLESEKEKLSVKQEDASRFDGLFEEADKKVDACPRVQIQVEGMGDEGGRPDSGDQGHGYKGEALRLADADGERRAGERVLLREEDGERGGRLQRQEGRQGQADLSEAPRSGKDGGRTREGGVADSERTERGQDDERGRLHEGREKDPSGPRGGGEDGGRSSRRRSGMGDANKSRREACVPVAFGTEEGSQRSEEPGSLGKSSEGGMADADEGRRGTSGGREGILGEVSEEGPDQSLPPAQSGSYGHRTWTQEEEGRIRRFRAWSDSVWHNCKDERQRRIPTEPELFPVAYGLPSGRVGLLRGAGNAIVVQVAAVFVMAYLEMTDVEPVEIEKNEPPSMFD